MISIRSEVKSQSVSVNAVTSGPSCAARGVHIARCGDAMTLTVVDQQYPDAPRTTTFQEGAEFQDFVCVELAKAGIVLQNLCSRRYQMELGENIQGVEIKLDRRLHDTGRLSVEVAEKPSAKFERWIPSGIFRDDNSWLYVQGNWREFFVFPKNMLMWWVQKYNPEVYESFGTIRKFYLELSEARKIAVRTFSFGGCDHER